MDVWLQTQPNPYPNGKVHISVVRDILPKLDDTTPMSTIWTMVDIRGVEDDLDKLATTRAIRDQRDLSRVYHETGRKAITAK